MALHDYSQARRLAGLRAVRRCDQGWTLIELLVVLSLIMILASLAAVQHRNSVLTAREATLRSDLYIMHEAIDQFYADKGRYPESLNELVSERYLRAVPKDPITNSADTWQIVPADPEPGMLATRAGIYKVRSGSDATALDGSRYADW